MSDGSGYGCGGSWSGGWDINVDSEAIFVEVGVNGEHEGRGIWVSGRDGSQNVSGHVFVARYGHVEGFWDYRVGRVAWRDVEVAAKSLVGLCFGKV